MRFAVKRLTKSDLTFFEPQFRLSNTLRQKSINLNRDVFVDELFPDLPQLLADGDGELEVLLRIAGPGASYEEIRIARKITKGQGYKNYRLNGEFVRNPEDAEGRFNKLAPNDIALFAFEGVAQPRLVRLFVISAAEPDDTALLAALGLPPGRSMAPIGRDELAAALAQAPPHHPIHDLFLEPALAADLEQAAQGDAGATERLLKGPGGRRVSAEQLAAARRRAEQIGLEGEQLVCSHLGRSGDTKSWIWRSIENAISPYDFEIFAGPGGPAWVEVKTTTDAHARAFHISMAEIDAAAQAIRYDLYRVSKLDDSGGHLQIAENIGTFARDIVKALEALPAGVRPDGFTVSPGLFEWSASQALRWPDAEEE